MVSWPSCLFSFSVIVMGRCWSARANHKLVIRERDNDEPEYGWKKKNFTGPKLNPDPGIFVLSLLGRENGGWWVPTLQRIKVSSHFLWYFYPRLESIWAVYAVVFFQNRTKNRSINPTDCYGTYIKNFVAFGSPSISYTTECAGQY